MPDIAIPIVSPDYLITVNTPKTRLPIPDDIGIPETKNKSPDLDYSKASHTLKVETLPNRWHLAAEYHNLHQLSWSL